MNYLGPLIVNIDGLSLSNTDKSLLVDDLIEADYKQGAEAEAPGTYVWISDTSEVLNIGEYGYSVKYRMHQHWASWPRTTRSNQKEESIKKSVMFFSEIKFRPVPMPIS